MISPCDETVQNIRSLFAKVVALNLPAAPYRVPFTLKQIAEVSTKCRYDCEQCILVSHSMFARVLADRKFAEVLRVEREPAKVVAGCLGDLYGIKILGNHSLLDTDFKFPWDAVMVALEDGRVTSALPIDFYKD